MGDYGFPHELVVEYTDQGQADPDPQEKGPHDVYEHTVHYIVRHPEGCDLDDCPIRMELEAVGLTDSWLDNSSRHLADGLYTLQAWSEHHSGPDGEDWSGGVRVEGKS